VTVLGLLASLAIVAVLLGMLGICYALIYARHRSRRKDGER